jgi:hypothetical protein
MLQFCMHDKGVYVAQCAAAVASTAELVEMAQVRLIHMEALWGRDGGSPWGVVQDAMSTSTAVTSNDKLVKGALVRHIHVTALWGSRGGGVMGAQWAAAVAS